MDAPPSPSGEDVAAIVGVTTASVTVLAFLMRGLGWIWAGSHRTVTRAEHDDHERRLAALEIDSAATKAILEEIQRQTSAIYSFLLEGRRR